MRRRRRSWGSLLALVVLSAASAHPDVALVDGPLTLAPGARHVVPMALHFHRLVATYAVSQDEATEVTLLVRHGDPNRDAGAVPAAEGVLYGTALHGQGRISQLLACCDGIPFADLELELRNDGDAPVTVDVRVWAVHDDFAVVAARAESGALEVPLALFAALGVAAVAIGWRDRRAPRVRRATGLPPTFWGSATLCAAGLLASAALGVAGAARYGGGLVAGMVAVMADVPVPGGPFGSRAALVMGVLLLLWVTAIALWLACVRQGAHRVSPWPGRLGGALALSSLGGGLAMAWTYGLAWTPAVLGVVLGAPIAWVAWVAGRAPGAAPVAATRRAPGLG